MKKILLLIVALCSISYSQLQVVNPVRFTYNVRAVVSGLATSKTFYIDLLGVAAPVDSSVAAVATVAPLSFLTGGGLIKNLRVKNIGNAGVTSFAVVLAKSTAISSNYPATFVDTQVSVNAPASTTATYSENTSSVESVTAGNIYILKVRAGANGGFSPTSTFISFDFYPAVN